MLNHPNSYVAEGWQGTLLIWATVILSFVINSFLGRWLPKIEGFILYLHIFGYFALIIPILHLADRIPASEVFTTWKNEGGWPYMGLAFLVGIISNIGPFIGSIAQLQCIFYDFLLTANRCRWGRPHG